MPDPLLNSQIDEAIALLRGFTKHVRPDSSNYWRDQRGRNRFDCPKFTQSWLHTGPLLDELAAAHGLSSAIDQLLTASEDTPATNPTELIARTWLRITQAPVV